MLRASRCSVTIVIALGSAFAHGASASELRDLLASPARYHKQVVTVTGIARGDSAGHFMLFSRVSDALTLLSNDVAKVEAQDPEKDRRLVDFRRVRVEGVVNANYHGILGNYRCGILIRKVEVLSGPVAPWDDRLTVYRNETGRPILLKLGQSHTATKVQLSASQCRPVYEWNEEHTWVIALSLGGAEITRAQTSNRTNSRFYDRANAAFYYRVRSRAIEPVMPTEAKAWGWKR